MLIRKNKGTGKRKLGKKLNVSIDPLVSWHSAYDCSLYGKDPDGKGVFFIYLTSHELLSIMEERKRIFGDRDLRSLPRWK